MSKQSKLSEEEGGPYFNKTTRPVFEAQPYDEHGKEEDRKTYINVSINNLWSHDCADHEFSLYLDKTYTMKLGEARALAKHIIAITPKNCRSHRMPAISERYDVLDEYVEADITKHATEANNLMAHLRGKL